MKKLMYIFFLLMSAFNLAAQKNYVIDSVCIGVSRSYQIIGEKGSTYEWYVYDTLGNVVLKPTHIDFWVEKSPGDTTWSSKIKVPWNDTGEFDILTLHFSEHGCDTLEQGRVKVFPDPEADAGKDMIVCITEPVILASATASNYSSLLWTTLGDGTFDDDSKLNPVYTVGINDSIKGSATLVFTVNGLAENATCVPVIDTLEILFGNPLIKLNQHNLLCYNDNSGSIKVIITGGIGPFTFNWTGPGTFAANTDSIFGLAFGKYTVSVTDNLGCIVSGSAEITQPDKLIAGITEDKSVICFGDSIKLKATQTGGTAVYKQLWSGVGATYLSADTIFATTFKNAPAGLYELIYTVTDANGCIAADTISVTVNPVYKNTIPLTVCENELPYNWRGQFLKVEGLYSDSLSSINGCDSIIYLDFKVEPLPVLVLQNQMVCEPYVINLTDSLVFAGSSPNLKFTYWLDSLATKPLTDPDKVIQSGRYFVRAENSFGCLVTKGINAIIEKVPVLVINNPGTVCEPAIVNLTDPSITAGSDKNLLLTYWLEEEMLTAILKPEEIAVSGTYFIRAENSGGCFIAKPVVVTIHIPPSIPVLAVTNPTCLLAIGTIEVTSPLGIGITYSIDGTIFQTETKFENLAPDDYTVTAKNSDGCISSADETIGPILQVPEIPVLVVTQPDCSTPTGTIIITSPVGAGLTYSIDGTNFQDGSKFEKLAPGDYTVTVKNSDGCISSAGETIAPAANTPEIPVLVVTQPVCGVPVGIIEVTSPLGIGLTYSIDGTKFQTETKFENLAPGKYTITVKNSDGCINSDDETINPALIIPETPILTVTQPECNITTGTIEVTSPLDAGLTYSIDGTNFQTETKFENLAAGDYSVTVKNNDGCINSGDETIDPVSGMPEKPVLTATQPDCDISTGTIEVTSPIVEGLTYSIDGTSFQVETKFEKLAPGEYTISVKNSIGCINSTDETIDPALLVPEIPVMTVKQPDCDISTGTIEVTSPIGAGLIYSIDGTNFQTETKFEKLTPGDYNITVKNNDGCINSAKETIDPVIDTPEKPVLTTTQPDCDISTGTIVVISPIGAGLTYSIDGIVFQTETKFENLSPGDYSIIVKNIDGCINSVEETIDLAPLIVSVSLSIVADRVEVDEGESVTFTATPVNEGTVPVYAWFVNDIEVPAATSVIFTYTPNDGDVVYAVLTSDLICTLGNPATSNKIPIKVKVLLPVSVAIAADQVNICEGGSVTFTAAPENGGSNPVYAWFVNGLEVTGATSGTYNYIPQNGDAVYAVLTSSLTNVIGNPATSNEISITIRKDLPVIVNIFADKTEICEGETVTFKTQPVNGGSNPVFAWFVNNIEITGETSAIFAYQPKNNDLVYVRLTSNLACAFGNPAISNKISIKVNDNATISVTISADKTDICEGEPVTYTALPANGGPNPIFEWYINGVVVPGETSITFTFVPIDKDAVYAVLISDLMCTTDDRSFSNKITNIVRNGLPVSVSVISDKTEICKDDLVTYTATPVNGGTNPIYAWFVNGTAVSGETSATYIYSPKKGEEVFAMLTSDIECPLGNPATSNKITVVVNGKQPASVSIVEDKNFICVDDLITFTATPVNGGDNPVYTWYVNNIQVPVVTSDSYKYQPKDGDVVHVLLTSDQLCINEKTAVSNKVTVSIISELPVSVSIVPDINLVCEGDTVKYSATPVNGGIDPVYAWFVNGAKVAGAAKQVFKFAPKKGDEVYTVMTSDIGCVSGNPATSNKVIVNVNDKAPVEVSIVADKTGICMGEIVTFEATAINGGSNPVYEWFVNGVIVAGETNIIFKYKPDDGDEINAKLLSDASCIKDSVAFSNSIKIKYIDGLLVEVDITADKTKICLGETVNFIANPINGGENPVYTWFVNGIKINGITGATYAYKPADKDEIYVKLTSSEFCVIDPDALSNTIIISITDGLTVDVDIAADNTTICNGETVILTAIPVNGGDNPLFAWFVNGAEIKGQTGITFAYKPKNGDQVYVQLTSSEICAINPVALSDKISITVSDNLIVSVTLPVPDLVCENTPVTINAQPLNGGVNPVYKWFVNKLEITGENMATFVYTPKDKDKVFVVFESDLTCVSQKTDTSNVIILNVGDIAPPEAICRNINVYLDINGKVSITASQIDNGSKDNCELDTLLLSKYDFDCADVGKNTVTLKAVDAVGLTDFCDATVTVLDTVKPVLTCRGPFEIQLDENAEYKLTVLEVLKDVSDACSTDTTYVFPHQLDCDHIGLTTIRLWAVGVNGDSAYCETQVTIYGNRAPNVMDDSASTIENVPVVIEVVSNDYDEKTSIDISSLAISIKPLHGTVTINPTNGDLTYTPDLNFSGVDVLEYRICDDGIPCEPECGKAYVFVNVKAVNDVAVAGDDYYEAGCFSVTRNVLDNDYDIDSDNLTVNTNPLYPTRHGELIIDPDGTIYYFPNEGFIGIDSFEYVICDNGIPSLCDTAKVLINVDCSEEAHDPLDCELFVPEGFSPNEDGVHDFFRIMCIHNYPNAKLMIFNRNGNLLWEKENYGNYDVWSNQYNAWWWGTSVLGKNDVGWQSINGEPRLKIGNYVYVLILGNGDVKNGTVLIQY